MGAIHAKVKFWNAKTLLLSVLFIIRVFEKSVSHLSVVRR